MNSSGRDHALAFLCALHREPGPRALVQLLGLPPKGAPAERWIVDGARTSAVDDMLELNTRGFAAYVGVNPRLTMAGGERTNIAGVHAIPIDVDTKKMGLQVADVLRVLDRLGLPPSIRVNSGNGGHLYLLLDRFYELDEAETQAKRIVLVTSTDAVWNASRIMRLPGTVNWKDPATLCYVEDINDARYSLAEVCEKLYRAGVPGLDEKPAPQINFGVPPTSLEEAIDRVPPEIQEIIMTGKSPFKLPSASEVDWIVAMALVTSGCLDDQIAFIFQTCAVGALKAKEAGEAYITRTIRRARAAANQDHASRALIKDLPHPPFQDVGGGFHTLVQGPDDTAQAWGKRAAAREAEILRRRGTTLN